MAGNVRVKVTTDHVTKVVQGLTALLSKEVLIGIPEDSGGRNDGPVNNATIGYAMEFGLPEQNVPARPFLIPGVNAARQTAVVQLRKATDKALEGDKAGAERAMYKAGAIAMNFVKAKISSNIPPPLSPKTIRARKYARKTKGRRPEEERYFELVKGGMDPGSAQTTAGITTLINTGQLRNSITYVLGRKAK